MKTKMKWAIDSIIQGSPFEKFENFSLPVCQF